MDQRSSRFLPQDVIKDMKTQVGITSLYSNNNCSGYIALDYSVCLHTVHTNTCCNDETFTTDKTSPKVTRKYVQMCNLSVMSVFSYMIYPDYLIFLARPTQLIYNHSLCVCVCVCFSGLVKGLCPDQSSTESSLLGLTV